MTWATEELGFRNKNMTYFCYNVAYLIRDVGYITVSIKVSIN